MHRQNLEAAAEQSSPVAQALAMFNAALRDGNDALASIWFDQLQVVYLQTQVQGIAAQQQLQLAAQGLPIKPITDLLASSVDFTQHARSEAGNQQDNPANGAVPFAATQSVGNEPSQNAGAFTAAPRQRDTGLVDPSGRPLTVGP